VQLVDGPLGAEASLSGSYGDCTDLSLQDRRQLETIVEALPLVADVCHADLQLYARSDDRAAIVYHAAPSPVPSLYPASQTGRIVARRDAGPIFRVLHDGRSRQFVSGTLVWGAPTAEEAFQITNPDGRVIGAVSCSANLVEHERLQRRESLFRSMVARVREQGFAGQLWGASRLGRLTEHDGVFIVDADGIVLYMSSVAENQYRRVGYVDSLVGVQISELETSEYICFQSMESGACLEQKIKEGDQVWIKRAIPLLPPPPTGLLRHLSPRPTQPNRAVVFIQDITDDVRSEQELKIKSAMIQEVHHRVKNNLQTVAFLLRMQARRSTSGAVRETLRQTISRVLSIAVVHEFLSRGDGSNIRIRDVCSRIAGELETVAVGPRKRIHVGIEGEDFSLPTQQATSCALVMNELLQNAVEHGFMGRDEGSITIRLLEGDASMVIEVMDDGVGLPPDFDPVNSSTLGLQIVQTLVRDDLHGQLEILNGRGVTARMSFPKELCRPV
jgi:two-component sensor histidine kinase